MRLTEVTVQNYRSITAQTKFKVDSLTTLVGPNNEGKTNLLRALALGMEVLHRWQSLAPGREKNGELTGVAARSFMYSRHWVRGPQLVNGYKWSDDFPLAKQATRGARPTAIRLRFGLSEEEISEFKRFTGITSNGDLPIDIRLGKSSLTFGVSKPGRGAATHRAKTREIATFVASKVSIVSVPAVRTGEQAIQLSNELARIRMRDITGSDEYRNLIEKLNELRRSAVDKVSRDLTDSVKRYIPSIESIELRSTDVERSNSIEDLSIHDSVETSIDNKGDGIKSLVTMALIQELAETRSSGHNIILAIDEPEAHLHAASVHELQTLFQSASQNQQVILATHNPIFVNRDAVDSNVLVRNNSAHPARNVEAIRSALGIELGDNLRSAETIVLVEGITDENSLASILGQLDARLSADIRSRRVIFRATHGTGQMRAQIQREKSTVCRILVVLDDDAAGRQEAKRIRDAQLLPDSDIFLLGGRPTHSELEDLIVPEVYLEYLSSELGRNFNVSHFRNKTRKWSQNLLDAGKALGISLEPEELVERAKSAVSKAVTSSSEPAIRASSVEHVQALAALLTRP